MELGVQLCHAFLCNFVSCLFRSIAFDASMRRYSFVIVSFILCYRIYIVGKGLLSDGTALLCIAVAAGFTPKCFPENCLPKAKIFNQNRCFTYVLQAWKPSFLCHVYWAQLFTFSMKKSK